MSKEAYYLKHFCNARNDRKVKKARLQLGIEAYAIFFMTLEVLREQQDFKYPLADLDILADDFGTSIQKVEIVVKNYGLFEIDEDEFFSIAQIKSLESWLELKEINKLKGQKSGLVRKKRLQNELVKLSQLDSSEPRFNNGSTAVELREEKRRKEKKREKKEFIGQQIYNNDLRTLVMIKKCEITDDGTYRVVNTFNNQEDSYTKEAFIEALSKASICKI